MVLDAQTEKEIREYEEMRLQEEKEFIENCNCREFFERQEEEDWKELAENADYYNDYECFGM